MSETPVTEPSTTTEPPAETPPAQETDWKAEARKWEARAKENSDAAAKLAALEDEQKTEAQKKADALTRAQAKIAEYEAREQVAAWKAEVSAETGVPADALAGNTREEIEAHAAILKPLINQAPTPSGVVRRQSNEGRNAGTVGATTAEQFAAALESIL